MYRIYTREGCGWCDAVKTKLKEKNIQYIELRLGHEVTLEMFYEACPGATGIPQIFWNGQFVGGYNELIERLNKEDDVAQFLSERSQEQYL
jgi:glutaredoxin 3